MEKKVAQKTLIALVALLLGIFGITYLISFLIRGYRPTINKNRFGFLPTGLLVANSDPEGASVYIDDKLSTATDDTVSLPPGEYQVKIEKDGFLPWQKNLTIKEEVVTQTNTLLFRATPDLKPLTNTGAINPTLSQDGTKIVYRVTEANSVEKNGIWILDLASNLPLNRSNSRQITSSIEEIDWSSAQFVWSPDNKEILLISQNQEKTVNAYLIPTDRHTAADKLVDAVIRLTLILEEWQKEKEADLKIKIAKLPKEMVEIATGSAELVSFSANNERFFYLAKKTEIIPENLIPRPPARSTQTEDRQIKPGNIYVYDIKQDINFYIGPAEKVGLDLEKLNTDNPFEFQKHQASTLCWLTNQNLSFVDKENNQVKVVEFDATNHQTVYAGPFNNGFVFPSPTANSLVVLTSLHPDSPGNLYEIKVR